MDTARRTDDGSRPRLETRNGAAPRPAGPPGPHGVTRETARSDGDLGRVPDGTIATLVATSLRGRVFELVGAFFAHEGCQEDPRPAAETGSLAAHARGAFLLRLITREELEDLERLHRISFAFDAAGGARGFEDPRVLSECARLRTAAAAGALRDLVPDSPRMRFLGAAQAIGEALERRSLRLANLGRAGLERG